MALSQTDRRRRRSATWRSIRQRAATELACMDDRCVLRPDGGYGLGGADYPWGWEPAPPAAQDDLVSAAYTGRCPVAPCPPSPSISRRRAIDAIRVGRGWNGGAQ